MFAAMTKPPAGSAACSPDNRCNACGKKGGVAVSSLGPPPRSHQPHSMNWIFDNYLPVQWWLKDSQQIAVSMISNT